MNTSHMCRLCMKTEFLVNLYKIDGETTLDKKIYFCMDIMVHPDDKLPAFICKQCTKKINKFYSFKCKCLQINIELKNIENSQILDYDTNLLNCNIESDSTRNKLIDNKTILMELTDPLSHQTETPITNKSTVSEKTEKIINKRNDKYQCEFCGCIFQMKTVLENHLMTHSGIKPYSCNICPKKFARAENKIIHMRSHFGIKPFICEICGKTSTKSQDLIRHMKIHSDERNYSCSSCKLQFKRSGDLTSHIRTHTGARPYRCLTCDKRYTSHSGLRKHYRLHCKKELLNNVSK
ncbi:zinc finger protein 569-like [Galleria mellonella]|uniref:Zinc finger protein 569-like n=1 Tax=Galleria mellonella TaxID=7137 RepID=A0A6J1WQ94_GALME|nr:zinc finger protein 569-like [Galleria mellonella]XP_052758572.1 zinc finger protein 569-like [Galleria mellonella]